MKNIPQELLLHEDVLSVVQKVAKARGITVKTMLSPTRRAEVVTSRHIAIYIARNTFDYGSKKLAQMFGYKEHGSVLEACKKIEAWKSVYPKVREIVTSLEEKTLHDTMKLPARFQKEEAV